MGTNKDLLDEIRKNNRLLQASLALQAQDYERAGVDRPRIELVLAGSGLGYQEIADILGKKPDAVRMFLKRNK